MEHRFVGSSGLQVSLLALGTLHWGEDTEPDEAARMLGVFADAGGTTLEVTSGIGHGVQVLGDILSGGVDRSELVIVARSGRWGDVTSWVPDLSRRGMLGALDATLAALGTDHVDVWLAHGWSDDVPLAETLSALQYAQSSGRTRYVGVSEHRGWQAARAAGVCADVVAASVEWSLVARQAEAELVPACAALGIGVLASSALGRGVLTGKYRGSVPTDSRAASAHLSGFVGAHLSPRARTVVAALVTAADGLGSSPAHVALAWLASRPELSSAVIGPRTTAQLEGLVAQPDGSLPPEIIAVLDEVSDPSR